MKIKDIMLAHGLMLCPMAGVSDRAFRLISAACGAEFTVTEMVSAKALVYEQRARDAAPVRTAPLCRVDEGIPTAVQIFGSEPEYIMQAARLISEGGYRGAEGPLPAAIDINMGCPVKKVTSNGEGSALMRDPGLAETVTAAAVEGAGGRMPITVKIRAGWDSHSINAPIIARAAERAGAAAVCVHARTREQLYTPGIDLSVIRAVREAVGIPVIGNGDITTTDDAMKMLAETGCDGLGIARGAIGDPWIFARIAAAMDGREFCEPSERERIETARRHLALTVEYKGERRGVAEVKPQIAGYIKGIPGAVKLRTEIVTATTAEAVDAVLLRLIGDMAVR